MAFPYEVQWRWRHEDSTAWSYDEVQATDATRAINKLIQTLLDEYEATRKDIVILAVYPKEN